MIKKYNDLPVQAKASIWFLICAFLQKGISTITTPIFTRLLTTSEYGQYNVFTSWMGIVSVIVTFNLFSGVYVSGMVKFDDKRNEYSSSLQGLCLTLVTFWTIVYLSFHSYWNEVFSLTTTQTVAMIIMIWTSAVFQFWATEQRVNNRYKALVIVSVFVSLLKPILGVILVMNSQDKVTSRIIGLLIVEIIGYTWMFVSQMKRGKIFFKKDIWIYALSFNIPLIPHYLSSMLLNTCDRLMIKKYIGVSEAGIYSLAYSVSLVMSMFNQALIQTLEPWLYKKIKENKLDDISKVAYLAFTFVAFINVTLIAFAPEVVKIFAPAEYYDAIYVIPPIAMSVYFSFLMIFFAVFEFYFKETFKITIATVSGAVLNIILNYYFLQIFGYKAAGYTTFFCYAVYALMHFYFMNNICNKKFEGKRVYDVKILLTISISFILVSFVLLLTYKNFIIRYILILVFCTTAFVYRKKINQTLKIFIDIRKQK